ncbi:MAG: cobalamin-independent methionine synthase II family protein [Acidimicrobiales bacterium]
MIPTTTIGGFPKPPYVPVTDWFTKPDGDYTGAYLTELESAGEEAEALLDRATVQVVIDQVEAGIDVPTDGEVRRENYIHYLCRSMEGFSFERLTEAELRGTTNALLPTIVDQIGPGTTSLVRDFQVAQACTDRPVKMTLPGPMTIIDTTVNGHYGDARKLSDDLATALNVHVLSLVSAGCRYIQIDEPLMARKPDIALEYGIEHLAACFEGVPSHVTRVVHACCGYPNRLDQEDYLKAPRQSYLDLAGALDRGQFDMISIEDAHRHNDLEALLPKFSNTTIVLGVIAIARSRIEAIDQIVSRLEAARVHLPADRLVAAPDCGLGYLSRELAVAKLRVLTEAARLVE